MLKAVDDQARLTDGLVDALTDPREPGKIRHSLRNMLRQRIFGICCGYGDTNDTARLNTDPMHKLLLDRDPIDGDDLARQPTLSRFENRRRPVELYRMGTALVETVITAHAKVGAVSMIKHLIPSLRQTFPKAIRVRLDGGFSCPEVLGYLDGAEVQYLVGMKKNSVLEKAAEDGLALARHSFDKTSPTYTVLVTSFTQRKAGQ